MKQPGWWPRVIIALVVAHIAIGVARIPSKVWGDRSEQIERHHDVGRTRYHLDNQHLRGAVAIEAVLEQAPRESIVLWQGEWKGAFEFVAPLIAPRLLVALPRCPPGTSELFGRPVATGQDADGRTGQLVIFATSDNLELRVR